MGLVHPTVVHEKTLPLDRRDGLLGTSVWIEGDQASVVISTMRPEVTAQLRYELSEPIDLANCTSIIEHGPMCIWLCRFRFRKFSCILMCGGMPAEHAERAYEHACPPSAL